MKHAHTMPFGAEVRADGRVRFRLWAPSASRVDLVLERAERGTSERLPMTWTEGGFFEIVTPSARAGSRYRYRIDDGLEVPDPASRSNPDDPNGASEVVDPAVFEWNDRDWSGRPWRGLRTSPASARSRRASVSPCPHLNNTDRSLIDTDGRRADGLCSQGRRDSNPQPPVLETGTLAN